MFFQHPIWTATATTATTTTTTTTNDKTNKHQVKLAKSKHEFLLQYEGVLFHLCAPPKIGSTLQIAYFFTTLPETTLKIAPNAPHVKLHLPTVDFQGWIRCFGSGNVVVNWRFGVWWFCWLILGTSPPCLSCILRHSTRIGTSGRPPHLLLRHRLTEPENGVRKPTYYATMRFRGDWQPQSFSDNMIRYSPYQQVSRISSINSINQLRFKTLRFLLLFLPTLVQIDVFSFSFTLRRLRLRSERKIHTKPTKKNTRFR